MQSDAPRAKAVTADAVAGGGYARTVAAKLYPTFAADAGAGNLAYSPASIGIALGMVRSGAQGLSGLQLGAFLHATDPDQLHRSLNGLSDALESRAGKVQDDKGQDGDVELTTADSFWGQTGVRWKAPFLDTLQREYGVGMYEVDYEEDAEASRAAINTWVSDQTHDEIPNLLVEGSVEASTRLALVNAMYLAAPWGEAFDEAGKLPFTTLAEGGGDGPKVDAPMMRQQLDTTYANGDHWQAVTIPYAGHQLAMTLVVPEVGSLAAVEKGLSADQIGFFAAMGSKADDPNVRTVNLTMPTFDIDARPDLTTTLKHLGVGAPFETEKDFEPMTTDPEAQPLTLAAMIHQATVRVDEKGTVAAAATAATFEATGAPIEAEPPVELKLDHPFLFIISDLATGAPLFIGRVTNPTVK